MMHGVPIKSNTSIASKYWKPLLTRFGEKCDSYLFQNKRAIQLTYNETIFALN